MFDVERFLLFHNKNPANAMIATPPTTGPAITPGFTLFFGWAVVEGDPELLTTKPVPTGAEPLGVCVDGICVEGVCVTVTSEGVAMALLAPLAAALRALVLVGEEAPLVTKPPQGAQTFSAHAVHSCWSEGTQALWMHASIASLVGEWQMHA